MCVVCTQSGSLNFDWAREEGKMYIFLNGEGEVWILCSLSNVFVYVVGEGEDWVAANSDFNSDFAGVGFNLIG